MELQLNIFHVHFELLWINVEIVSAMGPMTSHTYIFVKNVSSSIDFMTQED